MTHILILYVLVIYLIAMLAIAVVLLSHLAECDTTRPILLPLLVAPILMLVCIADRRTDWFWRRRRWLTDIARNHTT